MVISGTILAGLNCVVVLCVSRAGRSGLGIASLRCGFEGGARACLGEIMDAAVAVMAAVAVASRIETRGAVLPPATVALDRGSGGTMTGRRARSATGRSSGRTDRSDRS